MRINIFALLLFLMPHIFSQTQEKIPWPSLADSPWPVARGDVQGTGRSEYVGPKTPEVIWERTFPFGLITGPVIGEKGNLYFGTFAVNSINENYFYCTDSLGNEIWKYRTNSWAANDCAPAVASNEDVFFGSDNRNIYSLSDTGQLNWKYESSSAFDIENLVLDKVGNVYIGNNDSLYSFDSNGNIRFQLDIPGILGSALVLSPSGDTLYVHSTYTEGSEYFHDLYSISTVGDVYWSVQFDDIANSIAVDNSNRIYLQGRINTISEKPALYCINMDGSVKWYYYEAAYADRYDSGPTIDHKGNIIYYGQNSIVSVDNEGKFNWRYEFEIEDWFQYNTINVEHGLINDATGTIYAASAWGYYLYAISSEGELLWKLKLKDYFVTSGPVIGGDGLIYLGMHHGSWANNLENNLWAIGEKTTSVEEDKLPNEYTLEQNYPNPFNPSTTIKFSVPKVSDVKLSVYNTLGQEVAQMLNEVKHPGSYEVEFNGSSLSSGVYIYTLQTSTKRISRKMLLIK